MRSAFPFYFKIAEEQLSSIWSDGLLCFDASSLLNIYGYSEETSAALLQIIRERKDHIWSPHQFCLEYSRNRPKVIFKQISNFLKAEKDFDTFERERLKPRREHPHLSKDAKAALEVIKSEIADKRKHMERRMTTDSVLDQLAELFQNKVGHAPSAEELRVLHSTAATRITSKVPPGFKDTDKGEPDAFGDYIAWRQLMDYAKKEAKDIILVTDDDKEDWWWKEGSRAVAPLPELRQEFWEQTGRVCWFYSSDGFLRAAKKYTNLDVDEVIIDEVSAYLAAERQSESIDKDEPRFTAEAGTVSESKALPSLKLKSPDAPKGA